MPTETIRRGVQTAAAAPPTWIREFKASLSTPGELVGTLFFAASLSPSLLPRAWLMQGMLSGLALSSGYGIGVAGRWLWSYLELPLPRAPVQRITLWVATTLCLATAFVFLREASEWQNSIRVLMELEPVDSARPLRVGAIAAAVFTVVLAVARLFHLTFRYVSRKLGRRIPRRVANVIGLLVSLMIFWSVIDGVVFRFALQAADRSFQRVDARMEPDVEAPAAPLRAGSSESLVAWDDLGRTGRAFVSSGPTTGDLEAFFGEPLLEPIRVYVGLNAAESIEARAELALQELRRVGAFDRSVLVVVTPTGTGWVDPAATSSVEYLHRGDVASVAVQYSYLPSWLSLIVEPEYGLETADAVFAAVYSYWRELPRESRPALYLHGLSLGALNSQQASDLYDVIADPFAGALWSGPPFRSQTWRELTRQRDPTSPAWLPRFRDDSVVRFMNQDGFWGAPESSWGPLRIVYLQYASDPITFFEPDAFYRSPEWLQEPRGPDVSDRLRWYPVVTMLQLLADLAVGDTSPPGYGHVYAAEHYVDAWRAVTEPPGWTAEEVQRLKDLLEARTAAKPQTD
ncbi:MAG TPA: alpha/beta-hydrolase family protein [Longimicrobiales bacterium]|nr:alpha/beta-hydrolase family protein [Longimicrobiales bacterium]